MDDSSDDRDIITAAEDEFNKSKLDKLKKLEKSVDEVPKNVTKKSTTVRKASKTSKILASSGAKGKTIKEKVLESIKALNERQGSSLHAILKYMKGSYTIEDENRNAELVKRYLKNGVNNDDLVQVKRSFKLSTKAKKSFVDQAKTKDNALKPPAKELPKKVSALREQNKKATKKELAKPMPNPKSSVKNAPDAKKEAATGMIALSKVDEPSTSKSANSKATKMGSKQPIKTAVEKATQPHKAKPTKNVKWTKTMGRITLTGATRARKSVAKVVGKAKKKAVKESLSKENNSENEKELTTESPPSTSVANDKRVEPKTAGKARKYNRQKL